MTGQVQGLKLNLMGWVIVCHCGWEGLQVGYSTSVSVACAPTNATIGQCAYLFYLPCNSQILVVWFLQCHPKDVKL
jgi:hypothetical protein